MWLECVISWLSRWWERQVLACSSVQIFPLLWQTGSTEWTIQFLPFLERVKAPIENYIDVFCIMGPTLVRLGLSRRLNIWGDREEIFSKRNYGLKWFLHKNDLFRILKEIEGSSHHKEAEMEPIIIFVFVIFKELQFFRKGNISKPSKWGKRKIEKTERHMFMEY